MRYYLLIGVVIAVIGAWTAAWFVIADQVRKETLARVQEASEGLEARFEKLEVGGFPFRIRLDLDAPQIVLHGDEQSLAWRSGDISGVRHLWQPRHILLDLSGRHDFAFARPGIRRQLALDNSVAKASLETSADGRLQRFSLDIEEPSLILAQTAALSGQRLQIHFRPTPQEAGSVDLAMRGDNLEIAGERLPAHLSGMARALPIVDLRTTVTGLPAKLPPEAPVAHWRDGGGTVEVRRLHLRWGEMDITASGSLALDGDMRPIGALTAKIRGHDELIDLAVGAKTMSESAAVAARAVLGLLAAAGGGVLSVPVRLQDGQIFLGPTALAKLRPLAVK